jgi:hypothetical protein
MLGRFQIRNDRLAMRMAPIVFAESFVPIVAMIRIIL